MLDAALLPEDAEELEALSVDELELVALSTYFFSYSGPLACSEVAVPILSLLAAESSDDSTAFSVLVAVVVSSLVSVAPLDDYSFRVFSSVFYVLEVVFVF